MKVDLNIEEQENLYYFYHNWQAAQQNRIHKGECPNCNYGTGMRHGVNRGQNGVWIGPFSSLELCHDYIINRLNLPPVEPHNCCN